MNRGKEIVAFASLSATALLGGHVSASELNADVTKALNSQKSADHLSKRVIPSKQTGTQPILPTATPEQIDIQNMPVVVATVPVFPIQNQDLLTNLDTLTQSRTSDIVPVNAYYQAMRNIGMSSNQLENDVNSINSLIDQLQPGADASVNAEIALLRNQDNSVNNGALVFRVTKNGMVDSQGIDVKVNSLVLPVARPGNNGVALTILEDDDGEGQNTTLSLIRLGEQNGAIPVKFQDGKIKSMVILENDNLVEEQVQTGTVASQYVNIRNDDGTVYQQDGHNTRLTNGTQLFLVGSPNPLPGQNGEFYKVALPLPDGTVILKNVSSNPQLVTTQTLDFGQGIARADLTPQPPATTQNGVEVANANINEPTSTPVPDLSSLGKSPSGRSYTEGVDVKLGDNNSSEILTDIPGIHFDINASRLLDVLKADGITNIDGITVKVLYNPSGGPIDHQLPYILGDSANGWGMAVTTTGDVYISRQMLVDYNQRGVFQDNVNRLRIELRIEDAIIAAYKIRASRLSGIGFDGDIWSYVSSLQDKVGGYFDILNPATVSWNNSAAISTLNSQYAKPAEIYIADTKKHPQRANNSNKPSNYSTKSFHK